MAAFCGGLHTRACRIRACAVCWAGCRYHHYLPSLFITCNTLPTAAACWEDGTDACRAACVPPARCAAMPHTTPACLQATPLPASACLAVATARAHKRACPLPFLPLLLLRVKPALLRCLCLHHLRAPLSVSVCALPYACCIPCGRGLRSMPLLRAHFASRVATLLAGILLQQYSLKGDAHPLKRYSLLQRSVTTLLAHCTITDGLCGAAISSGRDVGRRRAAHYSFACCFSTLFFTLSLPSALLL